MVALSATVANLGSSATPASTVNFYLSTDAIITAADTLVGSVATSALAAGTQQLVGTNVTIPSTIATGTYFIGAIVDPANLIDEGNEANNAKAGNAIAISNIAVDLSVTAVSGPASGNTGSPIAVTATVANLGTAAAAATTLNFYLSSDAVIDSTDTLLAALTVPLPGRRRLDDHQRIALDTGDPAGGHLLHRGDRRPGERDHRDQRGQQQPRRQHHRHLDLARRSHDDGRIGPDDGARRAVDHPHRHRREPGHGKRPGLHAPVVPVHGQHHHHGGYAAGQRDDPGARRRCLGRRHITTAVPASVPAGTYRFGVIADPDNLIAETNKANNGGHTGTVAVGYRADLVMTAVAGPTSAATGQGVTFTGTVKNQGLAASPGVNVRLLRLDQFDDHHRRQPGRQDPGGLDRRGPVDPAVGDRRAAHQPPGGHLLRRRHCRPPAPMYPNRATTTMRWPAKRSPSPSGPIW